MNQASALYDIDALRALEARAASALGDAFEPMRRAGQAAWREVLRHWPQAQSLLVVGGPGNNGGDGYVLATHAQQSGRSVTVLRLPGHAPRGELAQRARNDYLAAGGAVVEFDGHLPATDVVVDALFGIGLSRAPDDAATALIAAINAAGVPVLALDVPSGIDAGRGGAPGVAVVATRTLEFIAGKTGLRTGAALDHVGGLQLAALDLDPGLFDAVMPAARRLVESDLSHWLPPRRRGSHKGDHGRVLCIGGDHGHGGAIMLAAEAALRSGAGLVDVITRPAHVAPLLARLPEAMAHADDAVAARSALFAAAGVIVVGPGLGKDDWGQALLARALLSGKPLVLDADALNLLAKAPRPLPAGCILTPHPGEAARLLGCDSAAVQDDRYAAARTLSHDHAATVVLKGAGTLVAAPGRATRVIDAGNPGMAVGGMGDALSGVIAALVGQGLDAFDAAACGALLHGAAGDAAARAGGPRGLLPSDLMPCLRRLANPRSDGAGSMSESLGGHR